MKFKVTKDDLLSYLITYMNRQILVNNIMVELHPYMLFTRSKVVSNETLIGLVNDSMHNAKSGTWKDQQGISWKYSFHGNGCRLISLVTDEPIEWDAPYLTNINVDWFLNWLSWHLSLSISESRSLMIYELIKSLAQERLVKQIDSKTVAIRMS